MKLCAKVSSERGKIVQKTGNENMQIILTEKNEDKFFIVFLDKVLKVLNIKTGKTDIIEY